MHKNVSVNKRLHYFQKILIHYCLHNKTSLENIVIFALKKRNLRNVYNEISTRVYGKVSNLGSKLVI